MNSYDRETYLSGVAGFVLPLAQSFVSGLIAALLTLAVANLADWERPGTWALGAGALVAAAYWFSTLASWRRVVYAVETATGRDWDGDNRIGEPDEPGEPIRIEVASEDGRHVEFIDLPASQEQLIRLAEGLLNGATLSEAAWTGAGNIFTRAEFAQLRNELIRRGLAAWNNPKTPARGATLTPGGQAAMRYFASLSASPSPTLHKRV
jgi:hypothetical protein